MTKQESLDDILESFDLNTHKNELEKRRSLTIWLPAYAKDRYDQLQEKSGKRFGKKMRELLLAAIQRADAKAS